MSKQTTRTLSLALPLLFLSPLFFFANFKTAHLTSPNWVGDTTMTERLVVYGRKWGRQSR